MPHTNNDNYRQQVLFKRFHYAWMRRASLVLQVLTLLRDTQLHIRQFSVAVTSERSTTM